MLDHRSALGAEFRQVMSHEEQGKLFRVVIATRHYETSQEDLWDAIANPQRIPRWFSPIFGDCREGGQYQLLGNAGGTITKCQSPNLLELTWEFAGNTSWLVVRLQPEEGRVRLQLEHRSLKEPDGDKHWAQYGPAATGVGWDLSLLALALHVDSGGEAIDHEANEVWLTSKKGKDFIRTCVTRWGEAHMAAGESAEVATGMASRTAQFYTGE